FEVTSIRATAIGLAPAQISQHGVGAKRQRSAVRLDGRECLVLTEGGIALHHVRSIVPLPRGDLIGEGQERTCDNEHANGSYRPPHNGLMVSAQTGTLETPRGLSWYSGSLSEAGAGRQLGRRRGAGGGARTALRGRGRIRVRRARRRAPAH